MRLYKRASSRLSFQAQCAEYGAAILLILTLVGGGLVSAEDKAEGKKPSEQLWFGTLGAGPGKLRLLVKLKPSGKGFRGKLVSLDQGKGEIPIDEIVLDNKRLKLSVKLVKGGFEGKLNANRTEARGTWTQLGQKQDLVLRRVEKIPDPADPAIKRNRPQTEELWVGTLKAGAAKLRMLVKLTPSDKGFRGNLVSLDQGKAEFPIDNIVRDNKRFKFSIKTIKGKYDGKLNADRTEARGTWTQLGRKMTLVLRRVDKNPDAEEFPKRAPFTGVRWEGDKPVVKIGEKWFTLVSLDGIAAKDIVAFSRGAYKNEWRKRFEEDLVEVLAGMGHKPKETVRLVVLPLASSKTRTLEGVAMTEANRQAIRAESKKRPASAGDAVVEPLSTLVPKLRSEKKLVGLAAMIMVDGKVVASAVDGERKLGSGVSLEIGDRFHIGSITKSITATMIARLIEQKKLSWTTTVGECLGDSIPLHADWRNVRLEQLLTHTSGAPANFPVLFQFHDPPEGHERMKSRKQAVAVILKKKPSSEPGSSFLYSNVGFTIAATMAEDITKTPWEDLVRREVFAPLKMTKAGFGPPQDGEQQLGQPRGHKKIGLIKSPVGAKADNTPIIGPAGTVHMTLSELCAFGNEHMRGERGQGKLLKAKTYQRLHTAKLNSYACGWVVPEKSDWSDRPILWHNGSNGMWYALVVLVPEHNAVIAVASNDGDIPSAEAAAIKIVKNFAKQD